MSFILTDSGIRINPIAPRRSEINIDDIAAGLAREIRYNGLLGDHYNVAHHSVMVKEHLRQRFAPDVSSSVTSLLLREVMQRHGLLHDGSEAYIGDIVKPLKKHLPDYEKIEQAWMRVILQRFGLAESSWIHECVKNSDHFVFQAEVAYLAPKPENYLMSRKECAAVRAKVAKQFPALESIAHPWGFEKSRRQFLKKAAELSLT